MKALYRLPVLLCLLGLSACGNSEVDAINEQMKGTWQVNKTSIIYFDASGKILEESVDNDPFDWKVKYDGDKISTFIDKHGETTALYEINIRDGKSYVLTTSGKESKEEEILTVSDKTLILKSEENGGSYYEGLGVEREAARTVYLYESTKL